MVPIYTPAHMFPTARRPWARGVSGALRRGGALVLLGLIALTSACGYKTSSSSFISNGTGTTTTPTVTSLSVEPFNSSLPRGLTSQFSAIALYSDGTKVDVSASVTWSSSSPSIATINATGLASAVNLGTTTITATFGTASGSTPLTVTAATLVSIDVTPASPSVASGSQLQLLATGIYTDFSTQNLTTTVTWSSNTPLVATIGNAAGTQGVASGVTAGTATITATLGAVSGSTLLTVTGASLISIRVTPANPSVPLGLQQQFTATGIYSNNTTQNLTTFVTWSSSSPAAIISNAAGSQGLATTEAVGSATISATLNGIVGSTTLTISPAALLSIAVTAPTLSIAAGTTVQFTATGTYTNGTTANITTTVVWNSGMTATSGTIVSPPVTLTVTPATLVSIAVTPVNPTIVVGATLQFIATGTYTDGATQVITDNVTWNTATPAVATISNVAGPPSKQGVATAASPGTTLITATFPGAAPVTSPPQTLTVKSAYAYATNTAAPGVLGTISQYSINPVDGQLTALTPATVPARYNAFSIAINPAGTFAYVANYNKTGNSQNSTISQYSISQVDGTLTSIGTPLVTESNPNSVTVDPQGKYVYVSNNQENNVSEYVIQGNGTLAIPPGGIVLGGAVFMSGAGPASIAINPADTFAYVANFDDGTVSQYVIGAGGALNPIPGEPATVAAYPQGNPSYIIVDPTGRYVYVTNQSAGRISEYSIGADGALTSIGTTADAATSQGPSFIAISASGSYAYVADSASDDVSQYTIANGVLTPMAVPSVTTGAGSAPYGVTIDATGRYLYVAERITAGVIAQFAISPVDGSLTPLAPATVPAGAAPTSIATTP
jgi:6-phosphogluconolactonase (cycloisomerase 2 family)